MDVKKKLDRCEEVFGEMGKNVLDSISDLSPRTVNHVHDYFANNLYSDQTLTSKTMLFRKELELNKNLLGQEFLLKK
ncbi:hypothetical protein N9F08_00040 [bacterium]|nr:hypothetical protein [bacterium]